MNAPPPPRDEPVLRLEGLSVSYPGVAGPALQDLHLRLDHGQRLALLGLNGSGKSTLLLALVGLLPHRGEALVAGLPLTRANLEPIRRRTGFLFASPEDQLLFPRVQDDVAFALRRRGIVGQPAMDRALEVLKRLDAAHLAGDHPQQLSDGQRVRVALAGALVGEPALLLLDEPTAALDPPGRASLARLLAGLDAAMVIATHDLPFARRCCTHFALLRAGRLARGPLPMEALPDTADDDPALWSPGDDDDGS